MSRSFRKVRGEGRLEYATSARELLSMSHPLNGVFVKFCGQNPPTKRQAVKFLAKYPTFRKLQVTK